MGLKSEVREGMRIDWDVPVTMEDGVVLRADVYRPMEEGRYPVYPGGGARLASMKNEFTGVGPFLHDDPRDRPPKIFGGKVTLHAGGGRGGYVLLPIIPKG